ncbi:hypothetical protein Taro_004436, partial [Colocasia esculenta]|nr:hypothetical protein [Colocasia esculenta]
MYSRFVTRPDSSPRTSVEIILHLRKVEPLLSILPRRVGAREGPGVKPAEKASSPAWREARQEGLFSVAFPPSSRFSSPAGDFPHPVRYNCNPAAPAYTPICTALAIVHTAAHPLHPRCSACVRGRSTLPSTAPTARVRGHPCPNRLASTRLRPARTKRQRLRESAPVLGPANNTHLRPPCPLRLPLAPASASAKPPPRRIKPLLRARPAFASTFCALAWRLCQHRLAVHGRLFLP